MQLLIVGTRCAPVRGFYEDPGSKQPKRSGLVAIISLPMQVAFSGTGCAEAPSRAISDDKNEGKCPDRPNAGPRYIT